jgi:large conductance mechanosensitive channel
MPAGYSGALTYADLTKAGANVFAWGSFVTIVINFVLLAFVIFFMVKGINSTRARQALEAAAPPPKPEEVLLTEIRDLLQANLNNASKTE